ncbi:hypothetical protein VN97_g4600 [Penicillium thymicola]|uniref:Uncharacterized protein n=1 Tax=Penicillium thymicola TaxID=293382 RepID=A0AAI9TK69_PENTH|nr:hypothetical protein VN97_g4600 [Penicillium thymicola]
MSRLIYGRSAYNVFTPSVNDHRGYLNFGKEVYILYIPTFIVEYPLVTSLCPGNAQYSLSRVGSFHNFSVKYVRKIRSRTSQSTPTLTPNR